MTWSQPGRPSDGAFLPSCRLRSTRRVRWTRSDLKVKAGLDGDGKLVALNHDVVAAWPTKRWGIPAFLSPSVDKKGALDAFRSEGQGWTGWRRQAGRVEP